MHAAGHGRAAHGTHRCYTGDAPGGLEDLSLFSSFSPVCIAWLQANVDQHRALGLDTQRGVQLAHHAAHGH